MIDYPFCDPTDDGHDYMLRVAKKGPSFIFDSKAYNDKYTTHLSTDERLLHIIHNNGKNEDEFTTPVSMNLDLYCLLKEAKEKIEKNSMDEAEEKALDLQVLKFFWQQLPRKKSPLKQESTN